MDNPAAGSLAETIRKIQEMARKARSGDPSVEDYLQIVSADPVTAWFTELLREKNEELEQERQRADRLIRALRGWYAARAAGASAGVATSEGDLLLINALGEMGIIEI
jgi:hypothetical protein